jgi:hypothetical protein
MALVQHILAGGGPGGVFGTIYFKHAGGTAEATDCYVGTVCKGQISGATVVTAVNIPLVGQMVHFRVVRTGEQSTAAQVPLSASSKTFTVTATVT